MVNPVRLERFFADEAILPGTESSIGGEYVISYHALNQVDWELNFTPQRMTIDAVLSEV